MKKVEDIVEQIGIQENKEIVLEENQKLKDYKQFIIDLDVE